MKRIALLSAVLALLVAAARVTVFHVAPKYLTFNTVQGVNSPG